MIVLTPVIADAAEPADINCNDSDTFCASSVDLSRSYLKKRILVQGVGGLGFQTTDIRRYFEDLKTGPNTQIGPKDFFEIASSVQTAVNNCFTSGVEIVYFPKGNSTWSERQI